MLTPSQRDYIQQETGLFLIGQHDGRCFFRHAETQKGWMCDDALTLQEIVEEYETSLATVPPQDCLTVTEWLKLKDWFTLNLIGESPKSAALSFTAGAARDAATAFESARRAATEHMEAKI